MLLLSVPLSAGSEPGKTAPGAATTKPALLRTGSAHNPCVGAWTPTPLCSASDQLPSWRTSASPRGVARLKGDDAQATRWFYWGAPWARPPSRAGRRFDEGAAAWDGGAVSRRIVSTNTEPYGSAGSTHASPP